MPIRITGMNSGLDTESIISELVKSKSEKKDSLVKEQTKLQWKQDAWKELNSKVYSFYSKTLSNMRLESDYLKKTTKVGDESAATVIPGVNAVNGVQTLKIEKLAKTSYLTGSQLAKGTSANTKISDLNTDIVNKSMTCTINNVEHKINIDENTTIKDIEKQFKDLGLNASFDEKNGRFFVSSKEIGAKGNFEFKAEDAEVLNTLGLNYFDENSDAHKIKGEDAEILLNGAKFTSDNNTFNINGLTITANKETDQEFTITTSDDTDGIYNMVKDFFKEYNSLINEMDKLYNADSAKGYEPLTDEEKDAMSEKEIEKWEQKIKDSILRKDSTLSNVSSAMKNIMMEGVSIGGQKVYLSDFGINTLGYFNSKDNERNAYHIDGDPDDISTSGNGDKLKTAIANDPEKVINFFSSLSKNLYDKVNELMRKTEYSSSFTLYDDVKLKEEYKDFDDKIKKQEQYITKFEDRYYKKFSAMETALAKMSSKESAISGLFNF